MRRCHHPAPRAARRAFTLVELLLVVSIFVLLLVIAVPAFSNMLYSSEQSLAENALRQSLSAARDAAARNGPEQDAAAVFTFEPDGRLTVLTCVRAGVLRDEPPASQRLPAVAREVFVPLAGFTPIQLPRGWMVRGYAPPNSIDDSWYEDTYYALGAPVLRNGNWLFPETGFFDPSYGDDGRHRQTFMVRFRGGTGAVITGDTTPILVLLPSPSASFRQNTLPWSEFDPSLEVDQDRYVRRILAGRRPNNATGVLSAAQKQQLLGDLASDTVLAKPVTQVAVYSEKRLAAAAGFRLDRVTGTMYVDPARASPPNSPEFVPLGERVPQVSDQALIDKVNQWIEGRLTTAGGQPIDSDCRVFSVQRFLGSPIEITGTRNGQGVSQ